MKRKKQTKIINNERVEERIINTICGILFPIVTYYTVYKALKGGLGTLKTNLPYVIPLLIVYIATLDQKSRMPTWKRVIRALILPLIFLCGYNAIYYFSNHFFGKGFLFLLMTIVVIVFYLCLGIKIIHLNLNNMNKDKKFPQKSLNVLQRLQTQTHSNQEYSFEEMPKGSITDRNPISDIKDGFNVDERKTQSSSTIEGEGGMNSRFEKNLHIKRDDYFDDAGRLVCRRGKATVGMIQRYYKIGFNRANSILTQLEEFGVVGPEDGTKPRTVLMNSAEFEKMLQELPVTDNTNTDISYTSLPRIKMIDLPDNESIATQSNDIDFSFLDNLDNILLISAKDSIIQSIVDGIINTYPSSKLRLLLCDFEGLTFIKYHDDRHLLYPTIFETDKAIDFLNYFESEIRERQKKMIQEKVTSIQAYNSKGSITEPLTRILIIIDEAERLVNNDQCEESLTTILLSGRKVGIHIILFSKFTNKNIALGKNQDLLHIIDGDYEIQIIKEFSYIYHPELKKSSDEKQLIQISEVDRMDGNSFEYFCKNLLQADGFRDIRVTKQSGDYGADIIAKKDDIRYVIQCKRYSGNVGEDAIQEVYASKKVYNAEVAVVLTNSYFTNQAIVLASHNSVHLWNRDKLIEMMN